jgi:peptidoglycan/LPS O-acetylase OafA/YrhL
MSTLGYSLNAIAFAFLLAVIVLGPPATVAALLRWRPLVYTGKIAYGLYLLHGPASWAARKLMLLVFGMQVAAQSAISVPITFLASFLVASISWRFFESPILAFKERRTRLLGNL